jgi:hypothetical protein
VSIRIGRNPEVKPGGVGGLSHSANIQTPKLDIRLRNHGSGLPNRSDGQTCYESEENEEQPHNEKEPATLSIVQQTLGSGFQLVANDYLITNEKATGTFLLFGED